MLWNDVNFALGTLLVTEGKRDENHEVRTIPLFQPLQRLLETIRTRKPQAQGRIFEIRAARMQILRACERLGCRVLAPYHEAFFSAPTPLRQAAISR